MLMHDNFLFLFPKMLLVRTMHAWLCSDFSLCIHNSQSSCVVIEEITPLSGTIHDKLFSASMTIFSKLLSIFVDSRVTNLILAICHARSVCCDLILHW